MTALTADPVQHSRRARYAVLALVLGVVLTACGGDADVSDSAPEAVDEAVEGATSAAEEAADVAEEAVERGEEMAESARENLEGQQAAQGGGSATLTVGGETWSFDRVLCAIGEEETGQEGAEFVLTSIQDGLQFYVSIDSFGHSVTLDDIEDFENPSVSLSSQGEDFIRVDGKNVSGEMAMVSGEDPMTELEASFEGVCP